jgi:hypothetical protein
MVGDAAVFADQLKAAGFASYEKVSLADLDITAVDFRRSSAARPAGGGGGVPVRAAEGAPAARAPETAPGDLARARALLQRAIAAKGGLDKLRAVRTVTASAHTIVMTPGGPVQADTMTYIEYPDRFRVEAKLPMGDVIQAYAGGEAWIKNPTGVQTAPPEVQKDFEQSIRRDVIALLLSVARDEATVRPIGSSADPLQAIEVSAAGLAPVTLYIDPVSGLVMKQAYSSTGPAGQQLTEELFSDYRTVDGLQVAFKAQVKRDGATVIERAVKDYRYNVAIDPTLFKKPS